MPVSSDVNRNCALRLAQAGLPIFPCKPDKRPLDGLKWRRLSTNDQQAIAQWWTAHSSALPAIDCGKANMVVLDGDRHGGPDGVDALFELFHRHDFDTQSTPIVRTPGNGIHAYFGQNGICLGNRRGDLPAGVDIRGDGGYVIAPGAELPDGRSYQPDPARPTILEGLSNGGLPEAPQWLIEAVARSEPSPNMKHGQAHGNREKAYANSSLNSIIREIAATLPGQRNHALNQGAFKLGRFVARGWLSRAEVEARLLAAACENGLVSDKGKYAAEATIRSGLEAGLNAPFEDLNERERVSAGRKATHKPAGGNAELVTEDSAAQRFADLYQDRLRYCHDQGAWFEWTGAIWRESKTGLPFQWARELVRSLSATEADQVRYVAGKTSFASGVERFCRSDPAFAVRTDHWDREPFLLGTPNGTVDLRSGLLCPSRQSDGITKTAAVVPARTADCPTWLSFLAEATGQDDGLIRFLQQWCGYCLTGITREHALVFFYGPGGNGKTVFLNTLTGILADYAVTGPMETFVASHSDRHPTDLAMFRGARLVTSSETEEGRPWAETRIKQMTGGDPITARFMRQDFFTYQPQFKLTIVGNHKPVLRNVDDAARRQFNIVPFTVKPANPDPELEEKLKPEWPAILRWMLDGCLDWQANGLTCPESVASAT